MITSKQIRKPEELPSKLWLNEENQYICGLLKLLPFYKLSIKRGWKKFRCLRMHFFYDFYFYLIAWIF